MKASKLIEILALHPDWDVGIRVDDFTYRVENVQDGHSVWDPTWYINVEDWYPPDEDD